MNIAKSKFAQADLSLICLKQADLSLITKQKVMLKIDSLINEPDTNLLTNNSSITELESSCLLKVRIYLLDQP